MDLPIEVLIHLFKFLPHGDRISAGQTCRLWHEAACDISFRNKTQICLTKKINNDESYVSEVFNNQNHEKFTSFKFKEMDLENKLLDFWKHNGQYIKCLNFDECEIHEKMFLCILDCCPNLEELSVCNCRELFMSFSVADGEAKKNYSNKLNKLRRLNLSNNRYLTDAIFDRLLSSVEALEEINLSECPITFHSGIHKKYYTSGDIVNNPSGSILTFPFILHIINKHRCSLKKLYLNRTLFDGQALKSISELTGMKLTSVHACACDQLNSIGIDALINHFDKSITELNVSMCSRITDPLLNGMLNRLLNLKYLNLSKCNMISDTGITALANLPNIQILDVSDCNLITSEGIKNGICKEINMRLLELNVSSLKLDEYTVILISEKFPNLRKLDVNFCYTAVTDVSIQAIFKNLFYLNALCLKYCVAITDAGLTGMGMGKQEYDPTKYTLIDTEISNTDKYHRISLRSRAEEEIVRDAKRKQDVREMCENVTNNVTQGYSLARLKSLQYLDLNNCNKISDVSLTYAFNSKELKKLSLSNCQQITHEGLHQLALNCHSIEGLDLENCYNTRDNGVITLVKNLHRLKYFNLSGCNLITDESLRAIRTECKVLKVLHVQRCPNISDELANSLYTLPTIHIIHTSHPDSYASSLNHTGLIRMPQPPPFPHMMSTFRRIFEY